MTQYKPTFEFWLDSNHPGLWKLWLEHLIATDKKEFTSFIKFAKKEYKGRDWE